MRWLFALEQNPNPKKQLPTFVFLVLITHMEELAYKENSHLRRSTRNREVDGVIDIATPLKLSYRTIWFQVACLIVCSLVAGIVNSSAAQNPATENHAQAFLSTSPTDDEIRGFRFFVTPLISVESEPLAGENSALAAILNTLPFKNKLETIQILQEFVHKYSKSRWTPSLRLELGDRLYASGYFSDAESEWDSLWTNCKTAHDPASVLLAETSLAKLLSLHTGFGRKEKLKGLLDQCAARPRSGSTETKMERAHETIAFLERRFVENVMCGAVALYAIKEKLNQPYHAPDLDDLPPEAKHRGVSAQEVVELAKLLDLQYQVAHRSKGGGKISTPAVIHWKHGHFSTLLDERDGLYLLEDRSLRYQNWVPIDAIEKEGSGYFLVPVGSLTKGWRSVPLAESKTVCGKHCAHAHAPGGENATDSHSSIGGDGCGNTPMASYSFNSVSAGLTVRDTPVGYTPPVGPAVQFRVSYKQYDDSQTIPAFRTYSNFGSLWSFNYVGFVVTSSGFGLESDGTRLGCLVPGGGAEYYTYKASLGRYANEFMSFVHFKVVSSNRYERIFPDGSKEIYAQPNFLPNPSVLFLSAIQDPAGNQVTLEFEGGKLARVRDAIGQVSTFQYGLASFSNNITRITDPFGRSATFQYDLTGKLTNITDIIGISSGFQYYTNNFFTNDFIASLTTPYGTTRFTNGTRFEYLQQFGLGLHGVNRYLEATDPLGQTEGIYFMNPLDDVFVVPPTDPNPPASTVSVGGSDVSFFFGNANLYFRNTFYLDKKAFREVIVDPSRVFQKAEQLHWIVRPDGSYTVAGVLESKRKALEGRVWYNYPGQGTDEETIHFTGTNSLPSKVARVLDDGTTQIYQYEYNSLGRVTKSIDPTGRTFSFLYAPNEVDLLEVRQTRTGNELLARMTYNAQHLPITVTAAAGQTNAFTYNSRGQLLTARNPKNETTTFNYEGNGYLLWIDGSMPGTNDQTRFAYDSFGRVRSVTDSEGYVLTFAYDPFNRTTNITYPDGTFEAFTYNRLDLESTRDRMGRINRRAYNPLRQLVQVVDPLNRTNRFDWCSCGTLQSITDAMGRLTNWRLDVQGRVIAKEYVDGSTIEYTYEERTSRLKSIKDEKGQIKNYEYFLDGNLKRVSYPNALNFTPSVAFTYDPDYNRRRSMTDGTGLTMYGYHPVNAGVNIGAGRLSSIDGPLSNDTVNYSYDALGRVVGRSIGGVPASVAYDALGRMTNASNLLGSFAYRYLNNTRRLTAIDYPNGQRTSLAYMDNLHDQRLQEIKNLDPVSAVLSKFNYTYNPAGQILTWSQQLGPGPTQLQTFGYDNGDQITSALVTTNGITAKDYGYAYDLAGNRTLDREGSTNRIASYNSLNELVSQSPSQVSVPRTYEWDAENRLLAVVQGIHRTEFFYDGLSRRVRIVEKEGNVVTNEVRYLWCESEVCEERGGESSQVRKKYFEHGYKSSETSFFYTKDHLSSIRELASTSGNLIARYNYGPYGRRMAGGSLALTDFGYAGMLYHQPSDLDLTLYRTYNSQDGRWLSRDPAGEYDGPNLYRFVRNNPINWTDPFGLDTLVIYGGPTANNPFGHASIAVTGSGIYSFGTTTTLGSSVTEFLISQSTYRDSTALIIKTTSDQEKAILSYLSGLKDDLPEVRKTYPPDTCANRTNEALARGGMVYEPDLNATIQGLFGLRSPFPAISLIIGLSQSRATGGSVVDVPKGTIKLPTTIDQFNPK